MTLDRLAEQIAFYTGELQGWQMGDFAQLKPGALEERLEELAAIRRYTQTHLRFVSFVRQHHGDREIAVLAERVSSEDLLDWLTERQRADFPDYADARRGVYAWAIERLTTED